MKKDKNIKTYTAQERKIRRAGSHTGFSKVDTITDLKLERLIAKDEDEAVRPDWTRAELIIPQVKQSVHLRLEQEVVEYFKSHSRGHISRMQAVLKSYVNAHRTRVK